MKFSWLYAVFVGGLAILSFSACSDSSTVGLGVGPDSLKGGQPVTLDVTPALDTVHTPPITGDNAREQPTRSAWRFLTGVVDDPVPGTGVIEAEGYVDFAGRASLPSDILSADNADSLTAELRLTTNYLHGRPDEAMKVEVYDLTEEADMDSARANVSFSADMMPASADTARVNPTDSLVTIELRRSWIENHLETLQDTSDQGSAFEEDFLGFKLAAPNSHAVVGFSASNATLRLTHLSDTVSADYPGLKTFTHVEQRNVTAEPPNNRILLQDGVGIGLRMVWDFDAPPLDTLKSSPLNRAEIHAPVDTLSLRSSYTDPDFVRPDTTRGFRVTVTQNPESTFSACSEFGLLSLPGDNCVLPLGPTPDAALVTNEVAFPIFNESLLEAPPFNEYLVVVADRESSSPSRSATVRVGLPSTLPVLLTRPPAESPSSPRASLTVTPL